MRAAHGCTTGCIAHRLRHQRGRTGNDARWVPLERTVRHRQRLFAPSGIAPGAGADRRCKLLQCRRHHGRTIEPRVRLVLQERTCALHARIRKRCLRHRRKLEARQAERCHRLRRRGDDLLRGPRAGHADDADSRRNEQRKRGHRRKHGGESVTRHPLHRESRRHADERRRATHRARPPERHLHLRVHGKEQHAARRGGEPRATPHERRADQRAGDRRRKHRRKHAPEQRPLVEGRRLRDDRQHARRKRRERRDRRAAAPCERSFADGRRRARCRGARGKRHQRAEQRDPRRTEQAKRRQPVRPRGVGALHFLRRAVGARRQVALGESRRAHADERMRGQHVRRPLHVMRPEQQAAFTEPLADHAAQCDRHQDQCHARHCHASHQARPRRTPRAPQREECARHQRRNGALRSIDRHQQRGTDGHHRQERGTCRARTPQRERAAGQHQRAGRERARRHVREPEPRGGLGLQQAAFIGECLRRAFDPAARGQDLLLVLA